MPAVRRGRPQLPRLDLGHRRRGARPRASRAWRRRSRRRRRSCCTRRTCSSTRCRESSRRGSSSLSGLPRAFFCNSGTEAVEACLKFARRYWHAQGQPRPGFVAFEHSFHGRTMGALSVTWDDHYRAPFAPLRPGRHVRAGRRSGRARRRGHRAHRRGHRRADPGRRRRAADQRRDGGGDQRRLQPDRRAADRRRSAVRAGPNRPAVLLAVARPAAGSHGARQVARRRACRLRPRSSATAWRRPRRSAITAARTAATCSRAAPRSCFSRSWWTTGSWRTWRGSARTPRRGSTRWRPATRASATCAARG